MLTGSDSMRFISAHMDHPTFYRYISAGLGYCFRPFILYMIMIIAGRYTDKKTKWFALPLVICVLLSILNIHTIGHGIMYSFSESNKFIRGPLGFVPHIVSAFYSVLIIYFSINNFKHNRQETLVVIIMGLSALTATLMENKFKFDFVLSQVLISSIIFYFFFLLTQTYKRDTLTHLLNRRCFYLELNHHLLKKPLILLSMDLNNLKVYNDTQGHAAGDKAITTAAHKMRKHFMKFGKLYRTGGDEFMAIFFKIDMIIAEKTVREFQEDLATTGYSVACGVAQYTPGDDIEKIINLSDERMYADKVKLKNGDAFKKF